MRYQTTTLFCILPVLFLCSLATGIAQEEIYEDFDESDMWDERSIIIAGSTTSYDAALEIAYDASAYLDLMVNLRELQPDSTLGLTWSPGICEGTGWEHPCYVARGRIDNGVYISIEYSDAYQDFSPGYYIVVVASGMPDAPFVQATLDQARRFKSDAYMKKMKVYMGCLH